MRDILDRLPWSPDFVEVSILKGMSTLVMFVAEVVMGSVPVTTVTTSEVSKDGSVPIESSI